MESRWQPETKITRNPRVVWRTFDREVAIIAPWEGGVRTLNEVGARCWELADGRPFRAIVDVLVNEFEVNRTALEVDLRAFLDEMALRNLLDTLEASA